MKTTSAKIKSQIPMIQSQSRSLSRRVVFSLLVLAAGLVLATPAAAAPFSFGTTGGLSTARSNHTATLLPSGKVLVAGGFNSSSFYLASAELYDPASGTWGATGSLSAARQNHTAIL